MPRRRQKQHFSLHLLLLVCAQQKTTFVKVLWYLLPRLFPKWKKLLRGTLEFITKFITLHLSSRRSSAWQAPVSKPDTASEHQCTVHTLIIYNCTMGFSTWLPPSHLSPCNHSLSLKSLKSSLRQFISCLECSAARALWSWDVVNKIGKGAIKISSSQSDKHNVRNFSAITWRQESTQVRHFVKSLGVDSCTEKDSRYKEDSLRNICIFSQSATSTPRDLHRVTSWALANIAWIMREWQEIN